MSLTDINRSVMICFIELFDTADFKYGFISFWLLAKRSSKAVELAAFPTAYEMIGRTKFKLPQSNTEQLEP